MAHTKHRSGLHGNFGLSFSCEDRKSNRRREHESRCAKPSYLLHAGHSKMSPATRQREEGYFVKFLKSGHVTIQSAQTKFNYLLNEWREETGGLSIARQIQSHPAYLKIIGMGERALPYLLAEVQQSRRFLFVALESIADEYPASEAKTFEEARDAWVRWGQDRNLI